MVLLCIWFLYLFIRLWSSFDFGFVPSDGGELWDINKLTGVICMDLSPSSVLDNDHPRETQ